MKFKRKNEDGWLTNRDVLHQTLYALDDLNYRMNVVILVLLLILGLGVSRVMGLW